MLKSTTLKYLIDKSVTLKKVPSNSTTAYFYLAFIAMAGLSYINFLPSVVNALAGGIGFSDSEAGQVVAMNGYGGILGSSVAIFLVRRIHWRPSMLTFMILLMIFDTATIWVEDYLAMMCWRFVAGILGGLCVGIALSVLARLNNPDRGFGLLLFIQFSIGSLVIYCLPGLEALLNAYAVFYVMASILLLSILFLLFLPNLPINQNRQHSLPLSGLINNSLLLLLAIFTYQVAASGIWAYVGLIGQNAGIDTENVSLFIAVTGMSGLVGAILPIILGNRFGRFYWVSLGIALSIIAAVMQNYLQSFNFIISPSTTSNNTIISTFYIISMVLLFFSWPAILSFLLAVTSDMDHSGRLSTIAGVMSSFGLASGPLLASNLVDNGNFSIMLYTSALVFLLSFLLLFKPVRTQDKIRDI